MKCRIPLALSVAANLAGLAAATAQPNSTGVGTLRLNDAERTELLNRNTETSVDAARSGLDGAPRLDRQVHGEVGATVGSQGYRSVYGAASIPLGQSGGAAVSFQNDRFDARR